MLLRGSLPNSDEGQKVRNWHLHVAANEYGTRSIGRTDDVCILSSLITSLSSGLEEIWKRGRLVRSQFLFVIGTGGRLRANLMVYFGASGECFGFRWIVADKNIKEYIRGETRDRITDSRVFFRFHRQRGIFYVLRENC